MNIIREESVFQIFSVGAQHLREKLLFAGSGNQPGQGYECLPGYTIIPWKSRNNAGFCALLENKLIGCTFQCVEKSVTLHSLVHLLGKPLFQCNRSRKSGSG